MKKGIKIAISGKSGCGNSTVSKLVAEKLELRMINYTFRQLAEEKGLEFWDLCEKAKDDFSYDRELDTKQVAMASGGDCVLGSRLAVWMLEKADLKIFLTASAGTRAKRIHTREGGDYDEVLRITEDRDLNDSGRYRAIYDIDTDEHGFVDIVINTDRLDQHQVSDIIVKAASVLV
ncbi:MAG: cytidylate kinase family protein [Spirochaetales bacterium]|nr:cytidylate kinase family protein [Spirochaetales bacterium]